jgi:hypothetical protein
VDLRPQLQNHGFSVINTVADLSVMLVGGIFWNVGLAGFAIVVFVLSTPKMLMNVNDL